MILRRYLVESTGCASYLFGCLTTGDLAVVDPHADLVGRYVEDAEAHGARIRQAIDTHVHADHPSGARALAGRAGAALRLPEGAPVDFPFEPMRDGEEIVLGRTRVRVLETPGHAWAHACLLVADTSRSAEPWLVFTGDTLLVGAVGRPDLHGERRALAEALRESLAVRLVSLPDWIEVHPGHVGGSACGTGISNNPSSTIGFERRHNRLLHGEGWDRFVELTLAGLATPPPGFAAIYEQNRRGEPLVAAREEAA